MKMWVRIAYDMNPICFSEFKNGIRDDLLFIVKKIPSDTARNKILYF